MENEFYRLTRVWLIAICTCIAMFASCTVNERYNERAYKEAALAKGMTATEIKCSWSNSWSNDQNTCIVLAAQNK